MLSIPWPGLDDLGYVKWIGWARGLIWGQFVFNEWGTLQCNPAATVAMLTILGAGQHALSFAEEVPPQERECS
jgi:hypothetical protein